MAKLIEITGRALSGEWGMEDENGNGIPVLRTTNFTNEGTVNYSNIVTRIIEKKNIEEKFLRKGDIIIEKSGGSDKFPVGRVIYFDGEENIYLFNNFTGLLRVKNLKKWYPKYVFYSLFANYKRGGTRTFENKTTGLHNLKINDYVSRYEVIEISRNKQVAICEKLDKIHKIIRKKSEEMKLLDELIQSRFAEMFGDVKYGTERWGGKPFKDITINLDSKRKPVKDADRKKMQGIYPYYGATGIVDYVNDYRQDGDFLLISEDGKALELRSKPIAFLASGKIWVNNHAHVQQCTDECNMIYLMYHINFMDISIWVTGIDQKKLNRANLDIIPIALPPIELQNQFADFVVSVDKSKSKIQKSLEETQLLFDSLMQKYFG
jgi:type I restriction enzyme S subunit